MHYADMTAEFRDSADLTLHVADEVGTRASAAAGALSPGDLASTLDRTAPPADQARWREAARLRDQRRGRWVIIWSAHKREFQARPVFTVRAVVAAGATIEDLAAEMDRIERKHARAGGRRRGARVTGA